jgi:glycosyltransferase involved in cell wall biosynthesis
LETLCLGERLLMKIAFYAPLKSPGHPVPSGDRLMGRLLMRALDLAGHEVELVSSFRNFAATPEAAALLEEGRQSELQRLRAEFAADAKPDLWFCYHPYYKSPDPFGPVLCGELDIPYVTVEASYSPKRDQGPWQPSQALVASAIRQAAVNIAMTARDRAGVERAIPEARMASIQPFIDPALYAETGTVADPTRLIAVAMMRPGDKMQSYAMLAAALHQIRDTAWTLAIAGDGPERHAVEALFTGFAPERIEWCGERSPEDVAALLKQSAIYVWPGCGEAYGLAYLEAQAAGLPAVAQETAGVPAVIGNGTTGVLTSDGDVAAYADAIRELLERPEKRRKMGAEARRFVLEERSIATAAAALDDILKTYAGVKR